MALSDSFVKQEFPPEMDLEEQRKAALLEEMGLEDRDVSKLQKTLLSPDEAVAAKSEELTNIRQHKGQRPGWEEFIKPQRWGRALRSEDFFRELRGLVPDLIIWPGGQRGRVGLYWRRGVPAEEIEGYRGGGRFVECPVYLGWSELGWLPEYEIDVLNDVQVAVGQRRGWRTILLNMIIRRDKFGPVITEDQAWDAFGEPTGGETSLNYRKTLWQFRNGLR